MTTGSGLGGYRSTKYMRAVNPNDGSMVSPTPKQLAFLSDRANSMREILFGGAAGGGKSISLLMAALQFVEAHPDDSPEMKKAISNYSALILRRTYADLSLPGALMDIAASWLAGTDAKWNSQDKTWKFPSGATLTFGYLERPNDKYRYQGSRYHFIAFDEATQFKEVDYTYLFSRLRKGTDDPIPLRMRCGSNPGGSGHDWIKRRFMIQKKAGRAFIPSRLEDNPYLDYDSYVESLNELDPITRRQLLAGDWNAEHLGNKFKRSWFRMVESRDIPDYNEFDLVRYWDFAATEPKIGTDPDYTASLLLGFHSHSGFWYILDVRRERGNPGDIKRFFSDVCSSDYDLYDGLVTQVIEQEPGASGKYFVDDFLVSFPKYDITSYRPSGKKEIRANPVSSRAEAGRIYVVSAHWNDDFFNELELFPFGEHDDQVDALSGAFISLADGESVANTIVTIPGSSLPVYQSGDIRLVGEKYVDRD